MDQKLQQNTWKERNQMLEYQQTCHYCLSCIRVWCLSCKRQLRVSSTFAPGLALAYSDSAAVSLSYSMRPFSRCLQRPEYKVWNVDELGLGTTSTIHIHDTRESDIVTPSALHAPNGVRKARRCSWYRCPKFSEEDVKKMYRNVETRKTGKKRRERRCRAKCLRDSKILLEAEDSGIGLTELKGIVYLFMSMRVCHSEMKLHFFSRRSWSVEAFHIISSEHLAGAKAQAARNSKAHHAVRCAKRFGVDMLSI